MNGINDFSKNKNVAVPKENADVKKMFNGLNNTRSAPNIKAQFIQPEMPMENISESDEIIDGFMEELDEKIDAFMKKLDEKINAFMEELDKKTDKFINSK